MSQKKTGWFEVAEGESIEECLKRMAEEGYIPAGRKEEPLFADIDGEMVPLRQLIKFKGLKIEK